MSHISPNEVRLKEHANHDDGADDDDASPLENNSESLIANLSTVPEGSNDGSSGLPTVPEGNDDGRSSLLERDSESLVSRRKDRPITLHPFVGWSLVVSCVVLTVIVAVLYWLSQKRKGLFTIPPPGQNFRDEVVQLIWSSGPTTLMTLMTGLVLAPMAFDLWHYAPYAELERQGGAMAQHSILANYTIMDPFRRIWIAWKNRKPGLVTLGIATLLSGLLAIAASGLFESRNVTVRSYVHVNVTAPLGIAKSPDGDDDGRGNHIFGSSDQYLAAASFAGGQWLYHPLPVPYTYWGGRGNWSITPLSLSNQSLPWLGNQFDLSTVANLTVETYGINTTTNCKMADVTFGEGETATMATATLDGCSYSFLPDGELIFPRWHFPDSTTCSNASRYDIAFKTFVYALYRPSDYVNVHPEKFIVMFCQPSLLISRVSATLSFTRQNGIGALVGPPKVLESFPIGSNPDDPTVASLLGPPLNGNALNGYDIAEPLNDTMLSRTARVNVTRRILYEGMYSALKGQMVTDNSSDPNADWFTPENRQKIGRLISDFYQTYVSTFSRTVYFDPGATSTAPRNDTTLIGTLSTLSMRAFISRLNAIALGVLLFLLALLLTVTLITQPRPQPGGDGVQLARNTLAQHAIASRGPLVEMMRPLSRLPNNRIADELRDRRFSVKGGAVVIHS